MKRSLPVLLSLLALCPALAFAQSDPGVLFERGALRRAETACVHRLAANPNDAAATGVLARIRAEQDRFDEAIKLAQKAVALAPGSADAHYALCEVSGQKAQAGGVLSAMGSAKTCRREAEAALALDPDHVDAITTLMEFYRQAPGIVGGDKKKATQMLDRLVKVSPERGWIMRAQLAAREQDSTSAEQYYRKAVEVAPLSARAKVALGSWLAQPYRRPAESEKLAAEAVVLEPWRSGGWQLLAALQAHQSRWDDMEATLARAEAADPDHRQPYYTAARQLVVEKREGARAEALLRKYLAKEPDIGSQSIGAAHWRLGLALELQGRKPDAIVEIQTAVKLDPKLEDAKKDLKRLRG